LNDKERNRGIADEIAKTCELLTVCDKWDWILILLSDLVEISEVDTESQGHPSSWQRGQVQLLVLETIG